MRYSLHLHHLNQFATVRGDSTTQDLWKMIGIVVGIIILCAIIGFVLACLRRPGGSLSASRSRGVRGVPLWL